MASTGLASPGHADDPQAWQDLEALRSDARSHVAGRATERYGTGVGVTMAPVDPRIRLAPCDAPEFQIRGERLIGRLAVAARCSRPASWNVYLTANVEVQQDVVVAARSVPRNETLTESDLKLALRPLSRLRDNYLVDVDRALGQAARRAIAADDVIYTGYLQAPTLVRKGESVTIASGRRGVHVESKGTALADGAAGSQIPVRNVRSDRVVHAWVTGQGRVSAARPGDTSR